MNPQPATRSPEGFQSDEAFAVQLDAEDPLRSYRERFHIPSGADGRPLVYFCGHSLGLQPTGARAIVLQELDDWAALAVEAHLKGKTPWYFYHEVFREPGARLLGAKPGEVVMMNSLTVNLHLMMVTFYRPTASRYKILMEDNAFPSDTYAVKSQIRHHGLDPADALLVARPRPAEHMIRTEDIEELLDGHGEQIALVLLGGVNFLTGQLFDMERIAAAGHRHGCAVGFDLAHAAGNVVLHLHDWQVDFAVWCSYKYLNAGPGAVAGCFVHEKHASNAELARFAGWWGNDPRTRFLMHLQPEFVPQPGAGGWQISNPPILSTAPLQASLAIFDEATMPALRRKSARLTGYLEFLLERIPGGRLEVITPREPAARGAQLSIKVHDRPEECLKALEAAGIVCDFRKPDILRVAPVPLYNTFREAWTFARVLTDHASASGGT